MPRRGWLWVALGAAIALGGALALLAPWDSRTELVSRGAPLRGVAAADGDAAGPAAEARGGRQVEVEARVEVAAPHEEGTATAVEQGAFLRVIDRGGAPAAGFALLVALARAAGGLFYAAPSIVETDEEGVVNLAGLLERSEPAAIVVLGAKEPYMRLEPGVLAVGSLGATRAEALEVRCSARASARVRGLVVDAASGAPLPDYPLRLLSWVDALDPAVQAGLEVPSIDLLRLRHRIGTRLNEWVTTDAAGRFESQIELPAARIHFLTYEIFSGVADHRIGVDGEGIELRVAVDAGPIVLLDFEPLDGYAPTDYIATLRRDGNEQPAYITELSSPLDPYGGERGGGSAAPVHAGPSPWVRIPIHAADEPLPIYFIMESRDRRHFGFALVEDLARHAVEPLSVALATREVLDLRIEWPPSDSDSLTRDILSVTFTRLDALAVDPAVEPQVESWIWRWMQEAETRTRVAGLTPGVYRVVAGAEAFHGEARFLPTARQIEIPREDPLRIAPTVAPPIPMHRAEVVVRTASGKSLDGVDGRPLLGSISVGSISVERLEFAALQWTAGTARAAPVVREGPATVRMDWEKGWFPTEPESITFESPGGPLEFFVRDDVPTEELVLRVLEPQMGGDLHYRIGEGHDRIYRHERFEPDAAVRLPDGRRAFEVASPRYAASLGVRSVELAMEGHEHILLGPADVPPADADGRRVVELVPRRGWSARVHVVTGADEAAKPQAGVALAFDGVETPASDSDGILQHRAAAQPVRVAVVTPGWELVARTSYYGYGAVHADSGRFTVDRGELTVQVRPKDR